MKKVIILAVIFAVFLTPALAGAQDAGIWEGTDGCNQPNQGPCTFCDALIVTQNIINFLWEFALALGGLMIAVGAILLMASGGSEKRQKLGKDALTYAVIGVAIALLSWVIINTVIMMLTGGSLLDGDDWSDPTCDEPYLISAPGAPEPKDAEDGVTANSICGGDWLQFCENTSNNPFDLAEPTKDLDNDGTNETIALRAPACGNFGGFSRDCSSEIKEWQEVLFQEGGETWYSGYYPEEAGPSGRECVLHRWKNKEGDSTTDASSNFEEGGLVSC